MTEAGVEERRPRPSVVNLADAAPSATLFALLLLLLSLLISSLFSYSSGRLAWSTILEALDGSPRLLVLLTLIARKNKEISWK